MAEQDQYAGITTVSPEPAPEAPPTEAPPETPAAPAPWEAKLAQLERLTQQLLDNAVRQASAQTPPPAAPQAPPAPPEPPAPPVRPQAKDFGDDQAAYDQAMEQWIDARADYRAQQRLTEAEQQRQRQAQEQDLQRTQAELDRQLHAREATLRQTMPDYDTRVHQVAGQMSPALYWAIRTTGAQAPDLALHLAGQPEVLARLNQTAPHLLGFEVGRLMPQLAPPAETPAAPSVETPAPAAAAVPAAPAASRPPPAAPPTMVTMGSVVPPSGLHEQMSQREYEAYRRQQNPRLFRR